MTNATDTFEQSLNPTLQRVRALIALLFQLIRDPARVADFNRICEEAERLLARCMFEAACRIAGRLDLLETHEACLAGNGGFNIRVRPKPDAVHRYHRIIFNRERASLIERYRRALGRRSRFSRKLSYLHFGNQRRTHGPIIARRTSGCASPTHTPARVSAPP